MSKVLHNKEDSLFPSPPKLPHRRKFIRQVLLSGIAVQLPFFFSCSEERKDNTIHRKTDLVNTIQQILFPDTPDSPGIEDTGAFAYFNRIVRDERLDPEEREYLQNGLRWVNETAQEETKKDFVQLTFPQQKQLIKKISAYSWGEAWLSRMLTVIFEALLLDPIYGVNLQESGWKWLGHVPGSPRPSKRNRYPDILIRKEEFIAVSRLEQLSNDGKHTKNK